MIGANIDWHRFKGRRKHNRLCDWPKVITWSLWREPKTLRTPVCLARAGLSVRDTIGIPKWPSKMRNGIVHHKSDRKLCVIPTADRNTCVFILIFWYPTIFESDFQLFWFVWWCLWIFCHLVEIIWTRIRWILQNSRLVTENNVRTRTIFLRRKAQFRNL